MSSLELLQNESEEAKNYSIKKVNEQEIVELTLRNVALVEAMIQYNSAYLKSSDVNQRPIRYSKKEEFKYAGSSAYWASQLKGFLENEQTEYSLDNHNFDHTIQNFIEAIDRENSTHLNADGVGREDIKEKLKDKRMYLYDWLKNLKINSKSGEYEIIDLIKDGASSGRVNLSFASKFAHYACFYMFEGDEAQDNFPIYDTVILNALPKYTEAFGIPIKKKEYNGNYKRYREVIDKIREAGEKKYGVLLSRNGLDQLLWYYHKGRN